MSREFTDRPETAGHVDDVYASDQFESTLDAAFPDRSLSEVTPLDGESSNLVVAVTTADEERYVVKAVPESGDRDRLARELSVTTYVRRETTVPVPDVVSWDLAADSTAMPWMVTRWAPGQQLADALTAVPQPFHGRLFESLGETLASLHEQTSFDAAGDVRADDPTTIAVDPADSWPEQFAYELADHVEALAGTRFEALAEDVWDHVSAGLETLDTDAGAVLLHGDLGDGNVVYDDLDVAYVLDWERAFVGHPEYDLCRAEVRYFWSQWGDPGPLQSKLYDGYRSRRELDPGFEDRRRYYLATFYLLSLRTYENWASNLTGDLDDFAESVAEKVRDVLTH